jgi:hypothetical protein
MKMALILLLVVVASCGTSGEPNEPAAGNSRSRVVDNNVEFSAETLIMESFPVQLRTIVRVTNRRSAAVDLTFPDGCTVLVRVYRDEARTSLAYDMSRVMGCTQAIQEFRVVRGEVKEFNAPTISAATILGDSLPNGTYYSSAVLRPNGKRIEVEAGSAPLAK